MDTLAQNSHLNPDGGARTEFLPAELPMAMSKQPLRAFEEREHGQNTQLNSVPLRRACIFTATAAMTVAGCYEMYEVLQVGGVTILEWIVLFLFMLLFAWIAFSFMSALAGFAVLLFRIKDPLATDPASPLPFIGSKNAM